MTPGFYLDAYMLRQLAEHPQQVQRTVSLSEDDARIRLTALTLLPGKAQTKWDGPRDLRSQGPSH